MIRKIADAVVTYIQSADKILWALTISASVFGLMLISSMQRAGDYNFLRSQTIAIFLGYIGAIIISAIDYRTLLKYWWIAAGVSLVLTLLVFPFGIQVAGTDDTAWLRLPGGLSFQPSELTKICFIVTFAKHLSFLEERGALKTFPALLGLMCHMGIPALLIHFQGDDGTVLIFFLMFLILIFFAGIQLRYFFVMLCGVLAGVPLLWTKFLNNEHRNRILVLFDLDENSLTNYGWQQYQGKVSIASGGLKGHGLYDGPRVSTGIVPEQENDFILTVCGEELGFIGCLLILAILFGLIIKCLLNVRLIEENSGRYICMGFFALLLAQTTINIGMVLGFLPVIGITLPFFSSGGTSAMCLYLGIGLVQNVYIHRKNDNDMTLHINKFKMS